MKTALIAICAMSASAFGQQAPVTRAEFAGLFAAVARGYVTDVETALPRSFIKDGMPVLKNEVAEAMVNIAIQSGRQVAAGADPVTRLRNAKILPEDAAFFADPGNAFRPLDLVKALIAFAEGFSPGRPKSDHTPVLTTPTIRRINDTQGGNN
jgi:hypothetical protein